MKAGPTRPDEIDSGFESAVRESTAAFGRGECFVERFLERARHLETQCLADSAGNVVVLSTRDCSLQRRNQKLVEEAPAPFLSDEQERTLYDASKAILPGCGYANAGTCEFLLAPDGTISFNEVNTRLQVEHPVTELVTGIDVVREQLRIAAGGLIDYEDPTRRGHAIEFRINGEDPGADFLPTPGRLGRWRPPSGPGVRWDGGYEEGDVLPGEFDSSPRQARRLRGGPAGGPRLRPSGARRILESEGSPRSSRWTGSSSITPTSSTNRSGCTPDGSRTDFDGAIAPSAEPIPPEAARAMAAGGSSSRWTGAVSRSPSQGACRRGASGRPPALPRPGGGARRRRPSVAAEGGTDSRRQPDAGHGREAGGTPTVELVAPWRARRWRSRR